MLETTDGRTFTRVARLPTPVRNAAIATIGDKIYLFGGKVANGRKTADIQEYDIGTERAVVAGYLPRLTSGGAAAFRDGVGYLLTRGRLYVIHP